MLATPHITANISIKFYWRGDLRTISTVTDMISSKDESNSFRVLFSAEIKPRTFVIVSHRLNVTIKKKLLQSYSFFDCPE